MTTADTWYAYFHVGGTFDPDEITRKLGVTPSRIATEGDSLLRTSVKRKCSLWTLRSRVEETAPIETHVKDVLDQLDTNKSGFVQLSRELGGTIQLVGYFREHEPGVHFDQETVLRIAEYFLCIDCDFYNRSSEAVGMTGEITKRELGIINNALNEVCNGIHLEDEFDTRMGCTVEDARALLAKIDALASN